MSDVNFQDVCKMAREHGLHILIKSEGYALCDNKLQTLLITNSLRSMAWFINNCDILGIIKV